MEWQNFGRRMLRAAKLDPHLYEEVEADRGALGQAVLVVVLASLAAGLGGIAEGGFAWILAATFSALIGWVVWAWLIYLLGVKVMPEPQTRSDTGELLRTIGFASSPGLIRVFGIIPGLTAAVNLIAAVWMLVAMVIAVRQALDYTSTLRAIGVCLLGWLVQVAFLAVLFAFFGRSAAG